MADLSLTIKEGERWAILGPNGCGKTVTAQLVGRLLNELHLPPAGTAAAEVEGDEAAASFISFETHRQIIRDELRQFNESRFTICHKRATVASYLFPELYPADPEHPNGYKGFRPPTTCLSPMPVPHDAGAGHPQLAEMEAASSSGRAGWLLRHLGLYDLRHQPVFGLSTGEGRKLMLCRRLLRPSRLLVLDEAFDGLDAPSRQRLGEALRAVLTAPEWSASASALIAHRREDYEGYAPTHALLLGRGRDGVGHQVGGWDSMLPVVDEYFSEQCDAELLSSRSQAERGGRNGASAAFGASRPRHALEDCAAAALAPESPGPALVEFRNVSICYPTSVVFSPPLSFTIREGEKWVVSGGNGSGKSTLIEIITGENMLAYQQDVWLFGRKKGSGESIWEIKQQLGLLSTEFHMAYLDYADPSIRTFADKPATVTTWEVVCSGFFDSVGLYSEVTPGQEAAAREWVDFFGIRDLVSFPARAKGAAARSRGRANATAGHSCPGFFDLSFGQQKLVLLCRAMVKRPRLLLLDEPTHGLSGHSRDRLLSALCALGSRPDVAVVYVTHRSDEVDALGFGNVLRLGDRTAQHSLGSCGPSSPPESDVQECLLH